MTLAITTTLGLQIVTLTASAEDPLRRAAQLEKWKASYPGIYISHREIAESDLPEDRTFRGAWHDNGQAIVVNADKAAAIEQSRQQLEAKRRG